MTTRAPSPGVILPKLVKRAVVDQLVREAPLECCGLLVGRGREVMFAVACRNAARSETRYRIAPREHIDLRRALRRFSPPLDIIGVYHSHPSGRPAPSPTDIAEAAYPEWIYLIVGRAGGRPLTRAYQIRHGQARALRVYSRPLRKR